MELCLYFNEGAMLIPLAARSRSSPLSGREGKPVFPFHGCRKRLTALNRVWAVKRSRAVRDRRINSHFTRVFANFKENGGGPTTPDCFNIFCLPACHQRLPYARKNRNRKRGDNFSIVVLIIFKSIKFTKPSNQEVDYGPLKFNFFQFLKKLFHYLKFEASLIHDPC